MITHDLDPRHMARPAWKEYLVPVRDRETGEARSLTLHGHTEGEVTERAAATLGPRWEVLRAAYVS
jgi:hypothetical protein